MYKFKKNFSKEITPIFIGILGLIPFLITIINPFVDFYNQFLLINLIFIYGSLILTFLGATYWGLAISLYQSNLKKISKLLFICSIIPFFFGLSLFILDKNISSIFLILGFILCQFFDEFLTKKNFLPEWYLILRRFLSVVVVSILIYCYIIIY